MATDIRNRFSCEARAAQENLYDFHPKQILPGKGSIQVLDFFPGAGGISLGFSMLPDFHIAGAVSTDPDASDILRQNFSFPVITVSVSEMRNADKFPETLWYTAKIQTAKPLFILGAPDASHGNNNYKETKLFTHTAAAFVPDVIAFINAGNLLTKKHWNDYTEVCKPLETAGYTVKSTQVNMASYGVPQQCIKTLTVAMKKDFCLIRPPEGRVFRKTVRNAIGDLPAVSSGVTGNGDGMHRSVRHKKSTLDVIRKIPHDGGNCPKDAALLKGGSISSFSQAYCRLFWDKPAGAVSMYTRNPASGRWVHPEQDRGLTLREMARLQTFPDSFLFSEDTTFTERLLGTAIPPAFSCTLAACLYTEFLSCPPSEKDFETSGREVLHPQHHKKYRTHKQKYTGTLDMFV